MLFMRGQLKFLGEIRSDAVGEVLYRAPSTVCCAQSVSWTALRSGGKCISIARGGIVNLTLDRTSRIISQRVASRSTITKRTKF